MRARTYLALTAAAVLVPLVLFAAVALDMLLDAEREAALRGVRETARATALVVDRELASAEAALRVLGTSQYLADGDLRHFHEQADAVTRGENQWIVLFDRNGQQLVNTRVPFGASLPRRGHPEYGVRIMRTQKPVVSDTVNGTVARQRVVSIEAPVPLDGGQRYVLGQAFVVDYFQMAVNNPDIPASWVIGLSDRNGRTIARNRDPARFVGRLAAPDLINAANAANEGVLQLESREGMALYAAFTHSAMSGWLVAVGVPVAEIEASARRAVVVASVGLLAAILCAVAMAALVGGRLARSIAGAASAAVALGHGEVPASARSGVAEVDKLHAALTEAGLVLWQERQSRMQAEAERTRLLASEQQARRLAESQNRAKDEFLAMLGHELRNPLSAISAAVALLEARGDNVEVARRASEVVGRQSRHLGRIVDDLLDLGRVMAGKVLLRRQPVDLAQAVCACVDTLRATGATAQHRVTLRSAPAWVDADPTRLEQIVTNLLVNASKYTPDGGRIDIEIGARGGEAVLTVRDTGIGISAQLLPHVFDVFTQGPAQLDRAQGGLGIGLALVQRLVALHGGGISAESDGADQGSCFTLRLPLIGAPAAAHAGPALPAPAESGAGKRLLLIEDNEDSRQTLAAVLALHGYRVQQAADGNEGARSAQAEPPHVAVVDVGLPGADGYEVARRLRADPATAAIGLIALTGYGQREDRQRALDAGFDLHLVKPVEPAVLLAAIGTLIRR